MEVLLAISFLFLALPVYWAWRLAWLTFRAARTRTSNDRDWPRVAVVLSLRGADPFLTDCLTHVLDQDYPHYQVHIVIDSAEDPAWDAVKGVLAQTAGPRPEVIVRPLERRKDSCSLKISAQLQALESLDPAVDVVAFTDADVIPSRGWLRALVAPLGNARVGATTAFRWYAPRSASWGSLVRYLWNAAACPQMWAFQIPWGGSLALHSRVFRSPELVNQWQESFGEDTRTYSVLRKLGCKLEYVPVAASVNAETISLAGCCTFIRRQLFSVRSSHALWPGLLALNVAGGLALTCALTIMVLAACLQNWPACAVAGAALAFYVLGLLGGLLIAEPCFRKIVRRQGQ
ncbi:MAG TPA: glycosyltransferase family 2 protein, partial [Gemmataceae bacterium]|nr:glycosyltransferase family 2 protein [Gemmataceae bacterium]